jgi:TfoX/Sxy family transcriptional regulator of competence genes
MASRQATVDFIVDQISFLGSITTRRMFGEFCIYHRLKPVGFVADDQLFIKPTDAGRKFAPEIGGGHPYPGSKPYLMIPGDKWEDREWLAELIRITASALPAPKPKKRG